MKSIQSSGVWDTLLIVAVAALTVTFSHAAQAVADEAGGEGRIVELSADDIAASQEKPADQIAEERPVYWLGIEGMQLDSPVLRTHLQLADDVGVVVRAVSPKSPAEKAGLRQHDIIIGVGGEQVTGMETLQKAVADSNAKPIELKVIRLAKEMTIEVTPENMPQEVAEARADAEAGGMDFNFNFNGPNEELNKALKALQQQGGGGGGAMRVFGPGMIVGPRFDWQGLPGGVSVAITRENDGPAKVTVKKGDQTWTVEGDDKEAIKKLPDDVRPFVEQMLGQQGAKPLVKQFQFGQGGQGGGFTLPRQMGQIDMDAIRKRTENANQRMLKQMEQMEKQLQNMQKRFEERFPAEGANPASDPSKT